MQDFPIVKFDIHWKERGTLVEVIDPGQMALAGTQPSGFDGVHGGLGMGYCAQSIRPTNVIAVAVRVDNGLQVAHTDVVRLDETYGLGDTGLVAGIDEERRFTHK
jgi:hypothetical protein